MSYFVYIMASRKNGTLYIGMTNDLVRRVYEHKSGITGGFTRQHGIHTLVHYEQTDDVFSAIRREKQLKKWYRKWKIKLIEESNPKWRDLYDEII